jgi:transposase
MDIQVYVGADIAAESIQIDWVDSASQQYQQVTLKQHQRAYGQLVKQSTRVASADHIQVVLEATGNYWLSFAEYLHQAGLVVSVLNPYKPNTSPKPGCCAPKPTGWMPRCCASMGG